MSKTIPKEDLDHILNHTSNLWKSLKNKTVFITGGTGFFGKWLLESFIYINKELVLNAKAIVLSRNPDVFIENYPKFKNKNVQFLKGDIQDFVYPEDEIHFIIHSATEASVTLNIEEPLLMYDTIVTGTKHILELAKQKKVQSILHTSSGAVYGDQPSEITHLPEDYKGCPDIYSLNAAYGEGKRVAEMLCNFYHSKYKVPSKIARCYAFVGPYLPLDGHFAVGNFINDIKEGNDIIIKGDGTPMRSYLYAADLMIWLWTILFNGEPCRPYNVGSDGDINIENTALLLKRLSGFSGNIEVKSPKSNLPVLRYVPNVDRAKQELNLRISIDLNTALNKTLQFHLNGTITKS